MTRVPEKSDLFLLNAEVWWIAVWVQKSRRGLQREGVRRAAGQGSGRGSRSLRAWQSLLRMSAQPLPPGIPSKTGWVL